MSVPAVEVLSLLARSLAQTGRLAARNEGERAERGALARSRSRRLTGLEGWRAGAAGRDRITTRSNCSVQIKGRAFKLGGAAQKARY